MSLLRDIQNSAVDASQPITSLLRKCKILAVRLGNAELKDWVDSELDGYVSKELPEYRIFSVSCKGHFSGPFGSGIKYADIPRSCVPEEARDALFVTYIRQPVSALESLINSTDDGTVQEPWPPDITAIVGRKVYENMNCLQAWKVIPVNALVATLDIIRNKVLNFVLEIEAENPEAGDAPINSSPISEEKVSQIFNTYITGRVQNVSTGGSNITQNASIEENSDTFNKMVEALLSSNGSKYVTGQLISLVEEMRESKSKVDFSSRYKDFMSLLSDHIQVYGPVLAPFLPPLLAMLP